MRSIITIAISLALMGTTALASEVKLRSSIVVEDKYITLSDLFGLPGEKGATPIAYAPAPGQRSTLDAKWLYRVARAHKIRWRPLSLKTKLIVERASQQVFQDDLKTVLLAGLREKGAGDDIELSMNGRALAIHLPTNVEPTIGLDNLRYNPRSGRFVATVAAPADDPAAKRHRITGRVHPMISIPVVSKRLRTGDIVKKHHITWTSIRESSVRRDTILHEEDLVGMAAKRMVREHSPIRLSYVQRPVLVRKNGLVTIHLASKSMTLTAQGQAMQDGSRGEIVQVKNIQSKKVIEAVVTHAGKVSVSAPSHFNVN